MCFTCVLVIEHADILRFCASKPNRGETKDLLVTRGVKVIRFCTLLPLLPHHQIEVHLDVYVIQKDGRNGLITTINDIPHRLSGNKLA